MVVSFHNNIEPAYPLPDKNIMDDSRTKENDTNTNHHRSYNGRGLIEMKKREQDDA